MDDTCSNCELRDAVSICRECEEVFCEDCALYHPKIKAYRGHELEAYEARGNSFAENVPRMCWNCEEQVAKFQCMNCPPAESYFCNGCSIIHPSVRAFKGHQLDTVKKPIKEKPLGKRKKKGVRFNEETTKWDEGARGSALKVSAEDVTIEEYVEQGEDSDVVEEDTAMRMLTWLRDMVDKYTRADDWQSRATVMLCTFLLYLLVKHLLGRVSVVLLVVLAYLTIRSNSGGNEGGGESHGRSLWESLAADVNSVLRDSGLLTGAKKVQNSEELERVRKQLLNLQQIPSDAEFKDEFWHTEKQPTLRKRPVMKIEVRNR